MLHILFKCLQILNINTERCIIGHFSPVDSCYCFLWNNSPAVTFLKVKVAFFNYFNYYFNYF